MDALVGALHVVAVVIAAGGAAKVASPDAFAGLLRTLGLPHGRGVARAAGVVEVLLGSAAVVLGGPWTAAAVSAAYFVFAVAVVFARRSGAASCGCFGAAAAPPSVVHVVVNVLSGSVALAAALVGTVPWIGEVLADQPAAGVPYVAMVAIGAWLVVTIDTTGASVLERTSAVAALGPTFQANAAPPPGRRGGAHVHR